MSSASQYDHCAAGLTAAPVQALRYAGRRDIDPAVEAYGIIPRLVPPGSRVLDVGCGTGEVSRLVAARPGCEVIGLEPDPERAEAARSHGLTVRTAELSADLRPALGQFDV